jgi:hypothetical protein
VAGCDFRMLARFKFYFLSKFGNSRNSIVAIWGDNRVVTAGFWILSWCKIHSVSDFSDCAPFFTIFFQKLISFAVDSKMIHIYVGRVLFKGCSKRWRRLNLFVENSGCVFFTHQILKNKNWSSNGSFNSKNCPWMSKFLANYEFCNRYVL